MEFTLIIIICLLLASTILIILFRPKPNNDLLEIQSRVLELQNNLAKIESNLKDDFRINREENAGIAKDNRIELNNTLKTITEQSQNALKEINKTLEDKVGALITKIEENNKTNREELTKNITDFAGANIIQLEKINNQAKEDNRLVREAMSTSFKAFQDTFENSIKSFNDLQREKFGQMDAKQNDLVKNTETKLESIRVTVEEKLEKTLSERLGQSFETVGKQLIEVQKGLGEMQTIASDVGGLKKVLSNVKLRGGVGEVQLALLLEQILAPNQYDANVRTKKGSTEPVEFAIKLPGRSEDESSFVYLPIDAKFPKDAYEHLIAAYENAIPDDIEAATKNMEATIRKMAKDIRDKYLDPPNTTDFAIMFLPFESIYAEVIRRSALVDQLRTDYKITVAGPTTLMAILNSLQMGFRTLALQKRSSEVWGVLATVKTEFEKFGGMLEKAQKNIQTGLGQLDDVVGARTRAIKRQLRNVESLPAGDEQNILPEIKGDDIIEIEE
ncbi:DNA recombination protein RmuC [Ferruginibacter sp. SUN106]|uniref:DNA recombination protein RmuC n=1 Tax=Ferruginibacter sp. SUN106 TaxID=2978348 RepID=UPI003D366FF2